MGGSFFKHTAKMTVQTDPFSPRRATDRGLFAAEMIVNL